MLLFSLLVLGYPQTAVWIHCCCQGASHLDRIFIPYFYLGGYLNLIERVWTGPDSRRGVCIYHAGIYSGNNLHPSVHLLSTGTFQRKPLSLRKALTAVLVASLSQVQSRYPGMDPSLEWSSSIVNRIAFHCRFLQIIPWIPSGRLLKLHFYLRENFTLQLTTLLFFSDSQRDSSSAGLQQLFHGIKNFR